METLATQEYLEHNYRWAGEFQRKSESQTVKEYPLRKGIEWRNGKQQHFLIFLENRRFVNCMALLFMSHVGDKSGKQKYIISLKSNLQ